MTAGTPKSEADDKADRFLVGAIGPAHGLKGEVKLKCLAENEDAYQTGLRYETEAGAFLSLTYWRAGKKGWAVARFHEISSREIAETYRGTRLFLDWHQLPELASDEFYHKDLVGLAVKHAETDLYLGQVSALFNYGAGDLVEIELGSGRKELLPFTQAFVPEVTPELGQIKVLPPDDLWSGEARADKGGEAS